MNTKGIVAVKIDLARYMEDHDLIELIPEARRLYMRVDASCLGSKTVNPQATLKAVKWFVIKCSYWEMLLAQHSDSKYGDAEFFKLLQHADVYHLIHEGAEFTLDAVADTLTPGDLYFVIPYIFFLSLVIL